VAAVAEENTPEASREEIAVVDAILFSSFDTFAEVEGNARDFFVKHMYHATKCTSDTSTGLPDAQFS
jgi:hypothetical protein